MNKLTRNELAAELAESKSANKIFSMEFVKRDGSIRKMTAKFRDKNKERVVCGKWNQGYSKPTDHNLINVLDNEILAKIRQKISKNPDMEPNEVKKLQRSAWRSVKLDSVIKCKINGQEYEIVD